jgi:hypothetical protein
VEPPEFAALRQLSFKAQICGLILRDRHRLPEQVASWRLGACHWPEHSGDKSSHRSEGEGMMPTEIQSSSTSEASPGQSDKRDQLLRIYDELDDVQKQELLRLAMVLLRSK